MFRTNPNFINPNIQRQPFIQQPRTFGLNRTIINAKEVDQSIVQKLFLSATTGNVNEIKQFIKTHGITINDMVDDKGQSILHVICKNENINEREKLHCIKYLDKHCGLKMSYNEAMETPLHIASKLQLYDIVKILLEAGHDVNALDVNGKTPLYYALNGIDEECPPLKKSSIKKTKVETSDVKQLSEFLTTLFKTEPQLTFIFNHLFNSAKNLQNIFIEDIESIIKKNNKKLLDILKTSTNKEKDTRDFLTATRNEIKKALIEKFDLKEKYEQTDSGWGPDNIPENKILKVKDIDYYLNDFNKELFDKKTKLVDNIYKNRGELNKKLNKINNELIDKINMILNYYYMFIKSINVLNSPLYNVATGGTAFQTDPTFNFATIDINVNDLDYNGDNKFIDLRLENNIEYDLDNNTYDDKTHLLGIQPFIDFNNIFVNNPNNLEVSTGIVKNMFDLIQNPPPALNINPIIPNTSKLFTRKLKVITEILLKLFTDDITKLPLPDRFDGTNRLIDNIVNELDGNNNMSSILTLTSNVQYNLLCLINYLQLYSKEHKLLVEQVYKFIGKIRTTKSELEDKNVELLNVPSGRRGVPAPVNMSKMFEQLETVITNIDRELFDSEKLIEEIYKSTKDFYTTLNELIEFINYSSAVKYMTYYYNNFTNFDNFFNRTPTEIIINIFDNKVKKFKDLPSKHTEFTLSPTNLYTNKRLIFETYVQQFNNSYYFNYYDYGINNLKPVMGFMMDTDKFSLPGNLPTFVPTFDKNPEVLYGNNSLDTNKLDNMDQTFKNLVGKNIASQFNKERKVITSIGSEIKTHIKILKYYLIRKTLMLIMSNYSDIGPTANPQYSNIITQLQKMFMFLREKLGIVPEKKGIVLQLLATTIDEIFNTNLTNYIEKFINSFDYKSENIDLDYDITRLLKQNVDFSLVRQLEIINVTSSADIIVKEAKKFINTLLEKGQYNDYSLTYEEDIFNKKDKSVFRKYSENILNNDKISCYKINPDLIDLLVSHRAIVSKKDKEGSSVLFTAIDTNNFTLFNKLIDKIPVYNKHSKNLNGVTPFTYSMKHLDYYASMFTDDKLVDDIVDKVNDVITKKTQKDVFRYQTQVYHMLFTMTNHYIYIESLNYINGYSLDESNKLLTLINMNSKNIIPIIDLIDILRIDSYNYQDKVIDKETDKTKQIKQLIEEKKKQLDSLNAELPTVTPSDRSDIITDTVTKLTNEVNSKEAVNRTQQVELQRYSYDLDAENINKLTPIIGKKGNFLKTNNIVDMYETINSRVINNEKDIVNKDYKSYMQLWKLSIEYKYNDPIMIISSVCKKLSELSKIKPPTQELLNNLQIIKVFLNKIILRLGENYTELDYVYNGDNFVLNNMINIIKHIVKNTMMVNLYNILQQVLKQYLIKLNPYNTTTYRDEIDYNNKLNEQLKTILTSSSIGTVNIHDYIFETLVEKIVKSNLELFEDENDPDKKENIKNYFDFIQKLISSNIVGDTSILKSNIDTIISFFKDYTEVNIKEMKKIVDGYIQSLMNLTHCVNITYKIVEKSIKEMSIV